MLVLWSLSPTVQSLTVLRNPSSPSQITRAAAGRGKNVLQRNNQSAFETRILPCSSPCFPGLLAFPVSFGGFDRGNTKYAFPHRFEARTLEEAMMLGFVTDKNVKQTELKLRNALRGNSQFQVKQNAFVEVS